MFSGKAWVLPYAAFVQMKRMHSLARRAWRKLTGHHWAGADTALPRPVPKRIWIYWDKGEAKAPPVVAACIASWRRMNPGWTVTVLDQAGLDAVVDMPRAQGGMTVQAWSDLIRLRLLRRHGGVWADATVYCVQPLDHWLPPLTRYGFFAFLWTDADRWFVLPNVHRRLTSWFLVSEPEGTIISAWEDRSQTYWEGRTRPHDYYWVHLILEYTVRTNRHIRRSFEAMPKLGAYGPHVVHDHVTGKRSADETRAALTSGGLPVQKLRWDWDGVALARAQDVLPEFTTHAPMPHD